MIPLRVWLYIAAAGMLAVLIWHDRHETKRANAAVADLTRVVDANHSQTAVIEAQSHALAEWKKLVRSPEDMQRIIDAANANARETIAMRGILARAKGKDRDLPDCIKLLAISLTRACPTVSAGLRDLANHKVGAGGDSGAGAARVPR
jgi:hypothetical protein